MSGSVFTPPWSAIHMPHVPFSAGFLLRSVLWKRGRKIRKQEEERSFFSGPHSSGHCWQRLVVTIGLEDRLVAAVSPGVCSSDRGRISRESYRCGFRGFDSGAQADSQSLHLTPSVAILLHPLLSPFYFSSPYASFVSNPLYLKHLAWFCLLDWMVPDTLLLALTTSSFLVWKYLSKLR